MSQSGKATQVLRLHYHFTFPTGRTKDFDIRLDQKSLTIIAQKRDHYPSWAQLEYQKCANCPLKETDTDHCPIAANLVDVIEFFKDTLSFEKTEVEITTDARTYKKTVAMQHALSSMIGIYMVTSGCPIMDKLRPLVRTHLPFATLEETTYRAISMYLLAQFFLHKNGEKADWELKNLSKIYEDVQVVNKTFRKRVSDVHVGDAGLNALVHLDCYARFTNMLLLEEGLSEIETIFGAYLTNNHKSPQNKKTK